MNQAFLGVDIGGSSVKSALVEENGCIIMEASVETQATKGPATIKDNIKKAALQVVKDAKAKGRAPLAAGVGCAGIVDDKGIVRHPPQFPGWKAENVAKLIADATGLPTWVDNDANVATLGEAVFGSAKDIRDFALFTLGTGVGGGIVLKGELYRGPGFAAGEIGHMIVFPNGKQCDCGARGCLERYVGIEGIKELAREKVSAAKGHSQLADLVNAKDNALDPMSIQMAAENGDALANEVLQETGEIIGYAATTLFNLLNIEAVLLAGGVSGAGEHIMKPMRKVVAANAHRSPMLELRILRASLGKKTGVVGAAALAMREYAKTV